MQLSGKYIFKYLITLFATTYFFYIIPSSWIEQLTAGSSVFLLRFFNFNSNWLFEEGITYLTLEGQRMVSVIIIRECTALNVIGIMIGLILPLKVGLYQKTKGMVFSVVTLFLLNIPRIVLTLYLTAYDVAPFTLLDNRNLETFHYPISFLFGVIGVIFVTLSLNRWIIPELGETLIDFVNYFQIKLCNYNTS